MGAGPDGSLVPGSGDHATTRGGARGLPQAWPPGLDARPRCGPWVHARSSPPGPAPFRAVKPRAQAPPGAREDRQPRRAEAPTPARPRAAASRTEGPLPARAGSRQGVQGGEQPREQGLNRPELVGKPAPLPHGAGTRLESVKAAFPDGPLRETVPPPSDSRAGEARAPDAHGAAGRPSPRGPAACTHHGGRAAPPPRYWS